MLTIIKLRQAKCLAEYILDYPNIISKHKGHQNCSQI